MRDVGPTANDFGYGAIAAPCGGALLFDRIVARATAAPDERQAWLLEALGAFGPDLAPRLIELVGDPRFKPRQGWPAVAAMLSRPQTRSAAWRAIRDRLPRIVGQFAASELELPQVESLGSLCDATARGEVRLFGAKADALLAPVLTRTSTRTEPIEYQELVAAMDVAVKAGFIDVGLTDPEGLSARPSL